MHLITISSVLLINGVLAASPAQVHQAPARRDFQSSNWCGQVLSGKDFREVAASWIVPKSSPLPTQYSNQPTYNYQWVGIDGATDSCQSIIQAGTYATLEKDELSYGFWYEFYPKGSWLLNEPTVNPGDEVFAHVVATNTTSGTAYMENHTTGQNITIDLVAPSGSYLCGSTVEWIQENASGTPKGFAPFSTFSFTGCTAADRQGKTYGLGGSEKWLMETGGQSLCYPSRATNTSVQINYSGPTV